MIVYGTKDSEDAFKMVDEEIPSFHTKKYLVDLIKYFLAEERHDIS